VAYVVIVDAVKRRFPEDHQHYSRRAYQYRRHSTYSREIMIVKMRIVTQDDIDDLFNVYRQCEDFLALGPEPKASVEMVLEDLEHSCDSGGTFHVVFKHKKGCENIRSLFCVFNLTIPRTLQLRVCTRAISTGTL
jgi:hypothetical protein